VVPPIDANATSALTPIAPARIIGDVSSRQPARWQDARLIDIIEETPDAVTLRLRLVDSADFLPGQYYNVRLTVPGRIGPIQRAYSVASSPLPETSTIDIGVREVPGGLISPQLVRGLSVGDQIQVRGPVGRFTWTTDDGGPVLLVGAGSGVVPLMSMIRYAVAADLDIPMRLVCASSSFDNAFYYRDLANLAERYPWLEVVHTFTRDSSDVRATHHRRIDRRMVADAVAGQLPRRAYICGPPAMVEDVQGWLGELGVDPHRVRVEKYD
jgi:ferredoxin-NADP reductase